MINPFPQRRWSATLGSFAALATGEVGPVWVQPHFSTLSPPGELPPIEVYEDLVLENISKGYTMDTHVTDTPPPKDFHKRVSKGDGTPAELPPPSQDP